MPRVSRSVSQRYANAAKRKAKRRGEGRAPSPPPTGAQPPVQVPAGLAPPAAEVSPPSASTPAARPLSARLTREPSRLVARRPAAAPIIDYSYVPGDLRRIGIVAGALLLALIALTFVPALH
jgi:hypothetical protein